MKAALLTLGDSEIELLEPIVTDNGVARYLETQGRGPAPRLLRSRRRRARPDRPEDARHRDDRPADAHRPRRAHLLPAPERAWTARSSSCASRSTMTRALRRSTPDVRLHARPRRHRRAGSRRRDGRLHGAARARAVVARRAPEVRHEEHAVPHRQHVHRAARRSAPARATSAGRASSRAFSTSAARGCTRSRSARPTSNAAVRDLRDNGMEVLDPADGEGVDLISGARAPVAQRAWCR